MRLLIEMYDVFVGVGIGDCRKVFCYDFKKKEFFFMVDLLFFGYDGYLVIVGRILYLVGE